MGSRQRLSSRARSRAWADEGLGMKRGAAKSVGAGHAARPRRPRRGEGLHERLVEIVEVREILAAVVLGFAENIIFDQIENDVAEVGAARDAPLVQHGFGQRAVLLERVGADALQELGARDVLRFASALGGFSLGFL